ncbi:MAG TPA: PepSY-like domain-containing protein [Puia sp.]|jgi:hypothetical protein|nr:PepSY-like domain-containing protein [Puia sp.]
MKKTFFVLLSFVALFAVNHADAQFRSLPGAVTDSFKVKYPAAKDVSWSDKVSAFQATFTQGGDRMVARFSKDGQWQSSTKTIAKDALPAAVRDGLSKSKYAGAEWEIRFVTVKYLPGEVTQYIVQVQKSDIQKKNLTFSSGGRLLKDSNTL